MYPVRVWITCMIDVCIIIKSAEQLKYSNRSPVTSFACWDIVYNILISTGSMGFWLYISLTYIYIVSICIKDTSGTILTKHFHHADLTIMSGSLHLDKDINTLAKCSINCLRTAGCSGFLYANGQPTSSRCYKVVTSNTVLDLSLWNGYDKYFHDFTIKNSSSCANLNIGVTIPSGWSSGCPKKYFPMNSYADIPGSSKHCGGIPTFLPGGIAHLK